MDKLLEFLKNHFKIILGVAVPVVLSASVVSYLSSKLGTDDQSFLFWLIIGLIFFAVIAALFLLFFFMHKRKQLLADGYGSTISVLKTIFRKLKKKNIKDIPLILFSSTGESSGNELFSRTDFNLLQLNKKEDNGFSVWYSPKFMILDIGSEIFDIASASSPLNKKLSDLLRFLRKVRRRAPINSYLISLPFDYFSYTSLSDIKNNAKNIAKRLEYIQHVLRIRFPAYLLIDRVDLVYGFYDYAANLGDGGFKQMMGWSSELKINEVLSGKNINTCFEELSTDIYKPLYKKQNLTSGNSGIPALCFCNTIKNIIPSLKCFIENVFSSATWHFNPIQLRGIYFTAIKSDNKYSYASYFDTSLSQLRYSKIPFDQQLQKFIGIKDNSVFFLEDLFRNKILKESSLITYTDFFLLIMRILKILLLTMVCAAIFLFIYFSFSSTGSFNREIMAAKAKSWRICSNVKYWEHGKFSPLISSSSDGTYSLKDTIINGKDNLAFILDFYRQNNTQLNIPAIYLPSEWIVGLNKQKNRARNTILYTSIINPLLEAFLKEYAVKINKFDDFTAEIFANVFEYAKILSDYKAKRGSLFSRSIGSGQTSGLYLYLEDTYRYLLKNIDKNTDNKLKSLSNVKIDLQQLFKSDSLPYGINRSFAKLKNSDFMSNPENYQNNIFKLIDFCVQDYMAGSKSINLHHHQINKLLIMEFLADAGNYRKDESHFFQNLSIDELIKKAKNLKKLIGMVDDIYIKISPDKKTVVMGYSLVVREQDSIKDSHVLAFDENNFTIKFDVNEDFRDTLFFELGLKKSLCQDSFFNKMLTTEQKYLFHPFYEMFKFKKNDFSKKYAKDIDTLKSDLLYGLALKNLISLLSEYNKRSGDETVNNIFSLLDNKEIKHNENIDFVIRYLVEFSIISKYLDILSKSSLPFTFKDLPQNEDFVRSVDKVSNAIDGLFPPDITVRDKLDADSTQPVKFQTMIKAEQNIPQFIKQWVSNAKKIISFIHINRDFVSKVYLLGQDYSRNFKQNKASDVWVAAEMEQEGSDYKPIPTLTRIKDDSLLGKVDMTGNKPLTIKFYRTFESLANHEPKEYLSVGTLPLLKFMIDNPKPAPMFNDEYSITWKAAKFDKDMSAWISKICFVYKGKKEKELDMYIAFTMPEGAECLKGCLESDEQKLVLKKVNENYQSP